MPPGIGYGPLGAIAMANQHAGLDEARPTPATSDGGGGELERLLRLLTMMYDERADKRRGQEREDREREREERFGTGGGLGDAEKADVMARMAGAKTRAGAARKGADAIASKTAIQRQRALKGAGLNPHAPYYSPPKPGETEAAYVDRIRKAKAEHEQRKGESASKLRRETARDKLRKAGSGKPWRAMMSGADKTITQVQGRPRRTFTGPGAADAGRAALDEDAGSLSPEELLIQRLADLAGAGRSFAASY